MISRPISTNAAIEAIRKRTAFRVHAETPALRLLGIEDRFQARIEWRVRTNRQSIEDEQITLDGAREEIERRPKSEIEAAKREFARRNKTWSYFPDEGPFRRELYPRHMEFIAATKTDDEIMMLAANRCLTPWSPVEMGHGERLALELIGEKGFDVRSWDGSSRCTKPASPVFLAGIEPAFQIHLDNGEVFQCSSRHRVLRHASMDARHPAAWCSVDHLIRGLSGLHWIRTARGWTASYGEGARLYDEPLRQREDIGDARLPIRRDAPNSGRSNSPVDVAASRLARSHVCQGRDQFSISDADHLLVDLCDKIEAPDASRFSLPKTLRDRIAGQLQCGLIPDPREILVALLPQLHQLPGISRFLLAYDSPVLFNGRSIIAVVPIGLQPIIDFTVPETHNYFSGGIVHHNTGKTQLGALCVAHWAMGRYPHWWKGRVFDDPVTIWICNKTAKDVRDINEAELLGPPGNDSERGTGFIPSHLIQKCTPKPGTPHAFEFINVEHVSGMTSYIVSKSYDQGREAFQGRQISAGWSDEEVPRAVYDEMRLRTMVGAGILLSTYTPIQGLTEMTTWFMESAGLSLEAMRHSQDENLVDV